jgi:hypothetical protein
MPTDDLKDNQKTDSLARFIEQSPTRTNPFGENRAAERAYRRAERIVAGIFMLTNHIPADEPLRKDARSSASGFLTAALHLRDEMRSANSRCVLDLMERTRYLISLVRIMAVSGHVSPANAGVIGEALDELGAYVTASQRSMLSENIVLAREDLMVAPSSSYRTSSGRIIKDTSNTNEVVSPSAASETSAQSQNQGDSLHALSVRVQSILEILKIGGSLGIKDISANLPEYSEKMIQRELLDLVTKGKVRKTGLKRWSRYSLVA